MAPLPEPMGWMVMRMPRRRMMRFRAPTSALSQASATASPAKSASSRFGLGGGEPCALLRQLGLEACGHAARRVLVCQGEEGTARSGTWGCRVTELQGALAECRLRLAVNGDFVSLKEIRRRVAASP